MSDTEHSTFEDDEYISKPGDVYLAFVDTPVKEDDELTIEDTFIGGEPVWLAEDSLPPKDMLRCGACKGSNNFKLLLQAFSPLDIAQVEEVQKKLSVQDLTHVNPDDDRVLYVFICTKCQRKPNSVRCIRGIKKNKSTTNRESVDKKMQQLSEPKEFKINPFDITKSDTSNPFSNPFGSQDNSNPFSTNVKSGEIDDIKEPQLSTKAQLKAAQSEHDKKKNKEFDTSKVFKSYLLYVEEESFKNKKPDHLKLPKNLKIDKEALDLTGTDEDDLEKDPIKLDPRTEKLSKFLDDDTFQKFQEVVAYNPHQVLRYDLGGMPLLYADMKTEQPPFRVPNPSYNSQSCRVFEMQLMPKLIMDLEDETDVNEGMEWGTILIYTDIQNFIPQCDENDVAYVEEYVKVQWESRK